MTSLQERIASLEVLVSLETLGDLIGGSSYFGHCHECGSQHVSTHDRLQRDPRAPWQFRCVRCAR